MNQIYKRHNRPKDQVEYEALYQESIDSPETFWARQASELLSWSKYWDHVFTGNLSCARWFDGSELNACYNCVDRHLEAHGDETALIWEGNEPNQSLKLSFNELHDQICRLANVLIEREIKKGDRVCVYLPMIPEAVVAMLACARIGAVHSVVFAGFSPEALRDRILDANCQLVITANESVRGSKIIPLKENVDQALAECPKVRTVLVVPATKAKLNLSKNRDINYIQAVKKASNESRCVPMQAEDPLFILYTSGSTGKPKGVLHTTAGFLVYTAFTFKTVFDYQPGEVYWCTADVGWITGHSYIVYGPLINRATTLIFEGVPNYPDASRFWQVVDKHQVNIFYTAPTAIRALMREGNEKVTCTDRSSLKLLGTVGEPINPEVWQWYYVVVGGSRCPIVDTWWQTETGGFMITPIPGITELKPGSASKPFFGINTALVDDSGKELTGKAEGNLVISQSWPGQLRTIYGDQRRFIETYLNPFPGNYFSGDGARRDEDDYYWITGRVDDVLNISGHRLGTAEIESALVTHPSITEAAVVGFPHPVKGEAIYAYVTLIANQTPNDEIKTELLEVVKQHIGSFAKPEAIQWAPNLPKTRSGKIMRRILRNIAAGELDQLGDTSTLADPAVIEELIKNRVVAPDKYQISDIRRVLPLYNVENIA